MTVTPRRVWQAAHVLATVAIPWAMAVYSRTAPNKTLTDSVHLVADYHTKAAIAAAALLVSSVLLRISGRSVAATVPFALLWAIALTLSILQVREYAGQKYVCPDSGFCIPDLGLFLTAVPFAVLVSAAVLGSAAIHVVLARDP